MSEPFMTPAGVYALLSDGRTVQIRPAAPDDFAAVKSMHEEMSPNNAYLRFFSLSRTAAEHEARRVTREPGPDHAALLAVYGGQVAGSPATRSSRTAAARRPRSRSRSRTPCTSGASPPCSSSTWSRSPAARQVEAFVAETLSENTGMLRVFSDAGLPVSTRREDGVVTITIPLPPDDDGTAVRRVPGHGRGARAGGQRGQPPAGVPARVGRGDRRQQAAGHGRPVGPREHQVRRLRGPALRRQPECPGDRRGALLS